MSSSRIEKLLTFLEQDPGDCFTLYALGLEYLKSDKNEALKMFEKVLALNYKYVPVYYQVAHLYKELGMSEKAISSFEKGIEVSSEEQDFKALNELRGAYNNYLLELDDLD